MNRFCHDHAAGDARFDDHVIKGHHLHPLHTEGSARV
jgi:hypothetical protein